MESRSEITDAAAPPPEATLCDKDSAPTNLRPPRRAKTIRLEAHGPWEGGVDDDDATHDKKFRLSDLEVDEETIFSSLDCHRRFKVKEGYEMKDLPKFNDLTRYDVDEEQEMQLWKFEVRRLVAAVKSEKPTLLEGQADWYGPADSDGYNRLHVMALAMRYSLDICVHDNELVLLEHQPALMGKDAFSASYRNLMQGFDPNEGTVRFDKQIKLASHNTEAYHSLVNYVTATMARVLIRTMTGKFWVENCLSTIAKFASKLKVVAHNLPLAVSRTVEAQNDLKVRLGELYSSQPDPLLARAAQSGSGGNEEGEAGNINLQDFSGARYFVVVDCFDTGISNLLAACVRQLRWDEEVQQTADMYETSAIIYRSGVRERMTHLCQERDGAVGSGAEIFLTRCAGMVFDVCREVWSELPSVEGPVGEHSTTLVWNWTGLTRRGELERSMPGCKRWTLMKDVINGFVPYVFYSGIAPDLISQFARMIVQFSDPTNPVKFFAHQPCLAAARLRTSQYERGRSSNEGATTSKAKFQNVYDTAMALEGALAGIQGDKAGREAEILLRKRHRDTVDKYRRAVAEVENWVIDQGSITITSLWYSYIVLAGVGILVGCGVALLAMEDRLAGVDPSNVTVLVWTAAGFLMVYFKSRRVEDWPWRDFLQGRVVCRSVSEVHAVTKIDPRALMAVLLRSESHVALDKCGPFRALFTRKGSDGFSIDIPPMNEASTAGGQIFIGVETPMGPALVGLEAKTRNRYTSIDRQGQVKAGEAFICRDFIDPASYPIMLPKLGAGDDEIDPKAGSSEELPMYPICTNPISWHRVKGVFVERALFC